jgi:AraC-like DNA-binding protein
MQVLYDTEDVSPVERFDYYQAGSARELAPVSVHGRVPGRLRAAMSIAEVGDIRLEHVTWSANTQLVTRRTERLIRAQDPECYRIFLCANGVMIGDQADNRVVLRTHDMTLFDLSRPCAATHGTDRGLLQAVMLSIPRAQVQVPHTLVRSLAGTLIPRSLPDRSLVAQFLMGLITPAAPTPDPDLADVLRDSVTDLIRTRLGLSTGINPRTRQALWMRHLNNLIRQGHCHPDFGVRHLARAAHISTRTLHSLCRRSGHTPTQLIKQVRLQECHRDLRDPALATKPVGHIRAAHGYPRADQFARDFRQQFGLAPSQIRHHTPR